MAVAQCPASCGELIQGWILGSEKLVSCPIAWYSTVEVCQGKPLAQERRLARAMVIRVLQHFNCPPDISRDIRIEIHSTIPVAKGMASSTADIAATAVATAHYLGYALDEDELARLCVSIEPTDSTIFHNPTLFAHNDASVSISCPPSPELDVLVLESQETLLTREYHRRVRLPALLLGAPTLARAWEKVQSGCLTNNPATIGEAATLSAIASQALLPKPDFAALLALSEACGLYGVNVAHSGSVAGLLLDRNKHDVGYIQWLLARKNLLRHWPDQHLVRMVSGGVTLQ